MPKRDLRLLIERKRDGGELEAFEWDGVVEQSMSATGDPAQISALLMACVFQGLSLKETVALTRAMVVSGDQLSFTRFSDAVDKHSSGGVGDTASLILVPLLAACGEHVAKLSGRALGHTGGTLDKLLSIPNFNVDLEPPEFEEIIARVGCSVMAQSARLVPADKALYELRDRTATVPCTGLIAASIVSKKIAGGAKRIAFDVKTGSGAFMKTLEEARVLAQTLVRVAKELDREAVALITDMNQPLSPQIGNGVEVILAREFLAGRERPQRLARVVREIAAELLSTHLPAAQGRATVDAMLASGEPARRFERMIEAQGGDVEAYRRMQPLPPVPVIAPLSGVLVSVDTQALGNLARGIVHRSGALAGIRLDAAIGDVIAPGQVMGQVFGGSERDGQDVCDVLTIADAHVRVPELIYERVTSAGSTAAGGASSMLSTK